MNTVTHWDLVNSGADIKNLLTGAEVLRVLGYSEQGFESIEQRHMVHPTLRERFTELVVLGRVQWYNNGHWPDYDKLLAWRGDPVEPPSGRTLKFFSQNYNHRQHRYNLVKGLAKRGLLDECSIGYANAGLPWEDCECGRIHFDEGHPDEGAERGKDPLLKRLHNTFEEDPRFSDDVWRWLGTCELMAPPVGVWHNHALNIVTETNASDVDETEKTWQVILYAQPFVSVTGSGWYSKFRSQGYITSDNVYSTEFDSTSRKQTRLLQILDVLQQLHSWDAQQLYDALAPSAEHNQRTLLRSMTEIVVPKAVKQVPRGAHSRSAMRFYENTHRVLEAVHDYTARNRH